MAKAAKFDQGYTVTAEGDQKVVSFMGDGLPWSGYIMFPIFYMVAIGFLFSPLWQLSLAAGGAVGYLIYLMYQRQTFIISPDGIIKKSVKYEAEKISEIMIDNPMDKEMICNGQPGIFIGGTGIAGASVAAVFVGANLAAGTMVHASQAISDQRSAAKRRHRVRIRYGSREVTLARNLKQPKAMAIFDLLTQT